MTWNRRANSGDLVDKDAVATPLAQEDALLAIEVLDQVASFHGDEAATWKEN
jgi:hypothetical protein